MGKPRTDLEVDFLNPLVAGDAKQIRSFYAQIKQHPDLAKPDLVSDPEFVFAAEDFLRLGSRKMLFATLTRDSQPVSMIPIEFGPEKNLPGEYISLYRHPTRLTGAGIACPRSELSVSLAYTIEAIRRIRPNAVGFSLVGLDTASSLYAELSSLFEGYPELTRDTNVQYYIELDKDATPDDFYNSQPRNYKKNFRRGRNRLDKSGGYSFSAVGPEGAWSFEDMARIDAMTWRADEKEGEKPKLLLQMCQRLSALANPAENSQLGALVFNGKPISMYYSLRVGGIEYGLKNTFNPEYSHYSPSIVAFHHFIEAGIEAGLRRFELMTGNQYMRSLANRERHLSDDVVFFKSARGRAAHMAVKATRKMRDIAALASKKLTVHVSVKQ